jgi:hypothetical protein
MPIEGLECQLSKSSILTRAHVPRQVDEARWQRQEAEAARLAANSPRARAKATAQASDPRAAAAAAPAPVAAAKGLAQRDPPCVPLRPEAGSGLGHIVTLYYRPSALYHIH